ncbi:MAG: glycosyltransferase [Bryobacteraceae bacterium]
MEAVIWVVAALMTLFTARRYGLVVASLLPERRAARGGTPSVTLLVCARDEAGAIGGLLERLEGLEYPRESLEIVLVSDDSRDGTAAKMTEWASRRPGARHVELKKNVGKAEALNRGLAAAGPSELVAVYDADQRPRGDALRILAGAFADARCGAAAGYRRPVNAACSGVARYAALECWVHQLVTQAAKDRMRANPTTMGGNCTYRRRALEQAGGFPAGAFSEDIEISHALVARGWSTRFLRDAVAEQDVVATLGQYVRQRRRWTQGLYASLPKGRRVESWLVSLGYADRLVALAAVALAAGGWMSPLWVVLYATAPGMAMGVALARAGEGREALRYAAWCAPMFAVDVWITLGATLASAMGRRAEWRTER